MRVAYLIVAHNQPAHLQRLITALASETAGFFIHVDAKVPLAPFQHLRGSNVTLLDERVAVHWGGFSQVEATLVLLRHALAAPQSYDRFVLLSGADYPLRSVAHIEAFFAARPSTEFINLVALPSAAAGKPLSRVTTYQVDPALPRWQRGLQKVMLKVGLLARERDYRPSFGRYAPFGGSSWWALTRPACAEILTFAARETALLAYCRNIVCPDESFFQTIIGNSSLRGNVARNLTYTDWSGGGASPATLGQRHVDFFASHSQFDTNPYGDGEMLFARKFGADSQPLLDALDRQREMPAAR